MKRNQMLGDHPLHFLGQRSSEKCRRNELGGEQYLGRAEGADACPNFDRIIHRCGDPTILHKLQRLAQGGDVDSIIASLVCHPEEKIEPSRYRLSWEDLNRI